MRPDEAEEMDNMCDEIGRLQGRCRRLANELASAKAAVPELHEALREGIERLADLPRYLNANGIHALASVVDEVLAKQRAALASLTLKERTE